MRNRYIIGNWKMNPTTAADAKALWEEITAAAQPAANVRAVVCPPHVYVGLLSAHKKIALGGQDCFWGKAGAYTGATSSSMLKDIGCQFVIVGHSERREFFGEDEAVVNKKVKAALGAGLQTVLAIGEKTRNTFDGQGRHTNELDPVVETQLSEALKGVSAKQAENLIVTYEPLWAISKGKADHATATTDDVMTAVIFIRKLLSSLYSRALAERVPVLYGGSTNSKNLKRFLVDGSADGALVGGASLKADEFVKMIAIAGETS
jgi:triosephosphate isomerase (TIM)